MKLYVKNIEPAWIQYGLIVEIPDDTPTEEIEDAMHEQLGEGKFEVAYGPEVIGQIDSMDQEYEITEINREGN